jgi:hypothetical protein
MQLANKTVPLWNARTGADAHDRGAARATTPGHTSSGLEQARGIDPTFEQ